MDIFAVAGYLVAEVSAIIFVAAFINDQAVRLHGNRSRYAARVANALQWLVIVALSDIAVYIVVMVTLIQYPPGTYVQPYPPRGFWVWHTVDVAFVGTYTLIALGLGIDFCRVLSRHNPKDVSLSCRHAEVTESSTEKSLVRACSSCLLIRSSCGVRGI